MVVDALHSVGAARSIVIDEDNVVLAGNGVSEAAAEAGITKVQVVEADGLTLIAVRRRGLSEEQKRALAIYDNRSGELAEWDWDQLAADKAAGLTLEPWFTEQEQAAGLKQVAKGGRTDPDEVPAERPTGIVAGDLFELGRHRLLCGDSTSQDNVSRLAGGLVADLVFTSPPYGQQRDYKSSVSDWNALMLGTFANLPVHEETQVIVNLGLVYRDGEWVQYWDGWLEWMSGQGWRRFGWYVWDQGPGLPGDWAGRCAPAHEWLFHFNKVAKKPNKTRPCKHAGETNHGHGLRKKDGSVSAYSHAGREVQETKIPDSVFRIVREKRSTQIQAEHPAPFPVDLPNEVVAAFSPSQGIVYEPFGGSGSTMIACEQLGRACLTMEIAPVYCQIIIDRWEGFTGQKAVKV